MQAFNATANQATSSLLFLSCIGTIIPTAATTLAGGDGAGAQEWILSTSRGAAVVLLLIYGCYLYFELRSHHHLFQAGEEDEDKDDDDGAAGPALSLGTSLAALALITACVAGCSELLTGAIESFTERTGLSQSFVGMIVLPIAGNACEHLVAVSVAMRGKMDLALGVAVGSSIQIAIFAIPLAVVVGWATGRPMSLDFDPFAVVALTVSVIHANFVTAGARSHWCAKGVPHGVVLFARAPAPSPPALLNTLPCPSSRLFPPLNPPHPPSSPSRQAHGRAAHRDVRAHRADVPLPVTAAGKSETRQAATFPPRRQRCTLRAGGGADLAPMPGSAPPRPTRRPSCEDCTLPNGAPLSPLLRRGCPGCAHVFHPCSLRNNKPNPTHALSNFNQSCSHSLLQRFLYSQ